LLLAIVFLNVVLIVLYASYMHRKTIPAYYNRCNTSLPVNAGHVDRPPTLVIFVFAETDEIKIENFKYFLRYGLCEDCANVDYAIVINGDTNIQIPNHKNLFILRRPNTCGDFGAWGDLFKQMDPQIRKKYKRFMFINDTVRGPFISPNYAYMIPLGFHFADLFNQLMTNETRIVGSYINCGALLDIVGQSHVQTMSFMLDDVSLQLSLHLFKCYKGHIDTIVHGELELSKNLLAHNINIGSLLYAYRGVDFRCNDKMRYRCNDANIPSNDGGYFGFSPNPVEVVFHKNSKNSLQKTNISELYTEWFHV